MVKKPPAFELFRALDNSKSASQASTVVMNVTFRKKFLLVCAAVAVGAKVFAIETNSISPPPSANTAAPAMITENNYLQIQEQLHATQLAIESSRQEAAAEAKRNADEMSARIQSLEQTVAAQRADEIQAAQRSQQSTLLLAVAFGLIVVAAVLFMAYLQWRAVARLVELSASRPAGFSLGNGRSAPSLVAGGAVEQSNMRLFGAVEHLEKRILELEQATRASLSEPTSSAAKKSNGATPAADDREECIANLLAEGQSLLEAGEPEKALECFDVALKLQSNHADALVKKGGALEKLGRTDEAIACYESAIEADGAMTIAYLHKGGLFNRMARYDEALQCYEQALQTHEKRTPHEKVGA
ncbi:MAG TPA: tetratricopeptide repeat protein [Verrucomicrobiae bacterium]